jgi:N-acetylmuramoyl-L-alanine amidase
MSDFPPDSRLVGSVSTSPNHDERQAAIDMILLHYTGMESPDAALSRLCSESARVSSHYFVDEDGGIVQLVPEARRSWHAGMSSWFGVTDINSCSIGIEIVNPGHDFGYPDFTDVQIEAVTALCRDIVKRRNIPGARVLGHSDVAPARKNDPGEKFPWDRLADAGVGLWVDPTHVVPGPELDPGDKGGAITMIQSMLKDFGYGIEVTGTYDEATTQVVTAFQRHFRPARVDGIADHSTLETLKRLLMLLA